MTRKIQWLTWLRNVAKDPGSPALITVPLGALTGQDMKVLDAIVPCWALYGASDEEGRIAALRAVRALLPGMQRSCVSFARELIPFALDWGFRAQLWPLVTCSTEDFESEVARRRSQVDALKLRLGILAEDEPSPETPRDG